MTKSKGAVEQVGAAVGRAADRVVAGAGHALGSLFSLHGRRRTGERRATSRPPPGTAAGIEYAAQGRIETPPEPGEVRIRVTDFCEAGVEITEQADCAQLAADPWPAEGESRWVDVTGLHPYVIDKLRLAYGFHTLAAEDVLHVPQRPRVEPYPGHLFLTLRMLQILERRLEVEQVSLFLLDRVVLTFQERPGDVWDPIRARLEKKGSRLRGRDVSFLSYALLDAIVDHGYPLLEHYGEVLEGLEAEVMDDPDADVLREVQVIRRELSMLRRTLWPTRELLDTLMRSEDVELPEVTRTYLRDVHGHAVQIIDIIEVHRELCGTLTDLYMSAVSNRMNEVMKTLTVIATLFIPLTFLAGVYGMNFKYIPELDQRWAYPAFWGVCISLAVALLVYFRRRRWL